MRPGKGERRISSVIGIENFLALDDVSVGR
jgi:hypothetical protein